MIKFESQSVRRKLLFVLILVTLAALTLMLVAFAGSDGDKGTIGIVCRNPRGQSFEIPMETKSRQDVEASAKFRGCVSEVVHGWTNNQITVNVLKLDEAVTPPEAGANSDPSIMIQGYTTYRNVLEEVKAERAKRKSESNTPPAPQGQPNQNPNKDNGKKPRP